MSSPTRLRPTQVILLLLAVALLSACSCSSPSSLIGNPEEPYPPPQPPHVGEILHLPTGTYVSREQMLRIATDSRIVYVGETHDNPASHRLELNVLQALVTRYPGQVALGMEMFREDQQSLLDRWLDGKLSDIDFLRATHFDRNWGWAYYRKLLLFAKSHRIPVIALNTPRRCRWRLCHHPSAARCRR
jgi:uncharacterized iron-regulated protein